MTEWATQEDWKTCRDMHRSYGASYSMARKLVGAPLRKRVDAVLGFVRVPNEWIADPKLGDAETRTRLRAFRQELKDGIDGKRPENPAMRVFVDVARETGLALNEPFLFLDAMESDLSVSRYPLYSDLERFMRGSAASVGLMVLDVLGVQRTPQITEGTMALSEAVQLTNVLRDIGPDLIRGHLYLPLEDMDRFGVAEEDLYNRRVTAEFIDLMAFEIKRTRTLFATSDEAISELPRFAQRPVRLARTLSAGILEKIEQSGFDVFHKRPEVSGFEKAIALFK